MRRMQPQVRSASLCSAHSPSHSRSRSPQRWKLKPLARAIATASLLASPLWLQAAPPAVNALPTGLQVTAGQASVLTQGNQMTVRNSNGAILNWSSFNIGSAAGVYFDQANAASKVLNRVTGNDPTQIFGSLASNGQVWLLNPNGVLFGQGARVDVAGLVASTLRSNDSDFLNGQTSGRYRFTGDAGSTAAVRNEGSIKSAHGGQVVMLGARVENTGSVEAPGGNVTMASARSVELVDTGLPNLAVRVDVPEGEALNMGRLVADGGTVDVFGAIVNQQGLVQADTLAVDAQGRITLKAGGTLMLGTGSVTQARGLDAGSTGGSVDLLGAQVGLAGTAKADVSGMAAGGSIRVGGGLQGRDSTVPNAQAVWFGPDAVLRADATGDSGTGGRIILWSDAATRAYGTLSARGGRLSGAGGFVETSGGWLDARPALVDVSSRNSLAGSWLLDPNDIFITSSGSDTNISGGPNFTSTNDSSVITTATLAAALNAGTSVSISTGNGGSNTQAGDILMAGATLAVTPTQGVTLTLQAARDIVINGGSTISSSGQPLNLNFIAAGSGQGAIEIINSSITTAGGNVTLGGANSIPLPLPDGSFTQPIGAATGYFVGSSPASATTSGGLVGINVEASSLNLGAGTFKASGTSPASGQAGMQLGSLNNAATVVNAADVQLFGLNSSGNNGFALGLLVLGQGTAINATQNVRLVGAGRDGVEISQGARLSLAATGAGASFDITGFSSTGNAVEFQADDFRHGLAGTGTRLTVSNAALNVTADSTGNAALVAVNDNGAPGPLFDLAAATSATFRVQRSAVNADWGAYGLGIANVEFVLPAAGATLFVADLGVALVQNVMTLGGSSASLSLQGQAVGLQNMLLTGSGSSIDFSTTGANPQGVQVLNTTLLTGGGNVRFGLVQNVSSGVLGSTTTAAPWVEYAGASATPALSISGSTIDASAGSITGGGANRSTTTGTSVGNSGTEIVQSNLTARQITLAGRSDTEIGLLVNGSTLFADRVLKLDGLSAGTPSNTGAGLYVFQGSTLQVSDAGSNAGSQLALNGKNIGGYAGVALEGGDAGTANETRLVVSGATLDIRGDGPVAGGVGVQMLGTQAAPGGLLINALGATSVVIDGTTSTGAGGGLKLQYATVLGPQATGSAPMVLRASGQQVNGSPALLIDNSTITTGGTLTVEGDGMIITSTGLTGENGLFLRSNASAATSPILVDQSILSTSAAGAAIRIESTTGGAAVGNAAFQSGTGVVLSDSGLLATGVGASIVINGRGAASGGTGVFFARSPLQADNITLTGTGVVNGHGIFSEDFTGSRVSTLTAVNLSLNGQSANDPQAPDKAGVRLGNGSAIVLSGGGAAAINGDTVVLGSSTGTQAFSVSGNAASFSVSSVESQLISNATFDFRSGTGTNVSFVGDSDANQSGRVRIGRGLTSVSVFTSGGNFLASGVGDDAAGSSAAPNQFVSPGNSGLFFNSATTVQAGAGTVTLVGSANARVGNGPGVLVLSGNTLNLTGSQINITGQGLGGSAGIDFGYSDTAAAANSVSRVLLTATSGATLTGQAAGNNSTTGLPAPGIGIVGASNLAVPGGALSLTSVGSGTEVQNATLTAQTLEITAGASLTLASAALSSSGAMTLTASGAGVNGSLLSTQNTSLTAGGALQLSGTSSDAGVGLMLLDGTAAAGSSVSLTGQSAGGPGVWFNSTAGTPTVQASSGALSITGRAAVGNSGVRITGGWQLVSATTLLLDSSEAFALEANTGGQLPRFRPSGDTTVRLAPSTPITLDSSTAANLNTALQTLPGTGRLTWQVAGSSDFIVSATLSVPGSMSFQADRMTLLPGAVLQAAGTGDALVLRGQSAASVAVFSNTGGAGALSTPNGRWVLLATDPRLTALGGLQPAFSAYDLAAQPWATDAQGNYITPAAGNALGYRISTAALNGQGLSGLLTKVYDATASITLNPATWSLTGLNSGDTLSFSGSNLGTLADKNVGTARPVAVGSTTFSVLDAGGRPVFGYSTPSFTANVTPLSVSLTGTTVANKVYDGNTGGSFSSLGSVTPLVGDNLSLAGGATATFSDKNVGTGKTVAVSGFALAGADAGNYTLVAPTALTADISARPLVVSGLAALDRVYDSTTGATLSGTASINGAGGGNLDPLPGTGVVTGDAVVLLGTASANFADKNVGNAKPVIVTGYSLTGADAGNYTLAQPTGLQASITPASVSLTGLTAQSRVYDSTSTASLLGTASVTPLAGDALTLAGTAQGRFGDKNVGTAKPVTLTGLALAGTDAANYVLVTPGYSADITPAALGLLNVAAGSRTYDSTRSASMGGTLTGVLPGDAVNLGLTGQFSDANVGTAKPVAWTATTTGADAGNYTLAPASGTAQANITPATLTYTASPLVGTVGQALPVLTGNVSGFVGTDTQGNATTGALTWTTTATVASAVGQYAITGSGLSALNYALVQAAANARALTLQAPTTADAATTATNVVTTAALFSVQLPVTMSTPTQGRVLDVTTAFAPAGSAADGMAFRASSSSGGDAGAALPASGGAAGVGNAVGAGSSGSSGSPVLAGAAGTAAAAGTTAPAGGTAAATGPAGATGATGAAGAAGAADAATTNTSPGSGSSGGSVPVAAVPLTIEQGRAVALRAAGEAADGIAFRALDLSRLPRDEVQSLLAARARYKQKVFSKGVFRLQQDPTLADVRACRSEAELETGACIVTEQLKQEIQAARAKAASMAAPRAERTRRGVKVAALPVIERKLALVIGINKYDDRNIPELMGSVPDARSVRQILDARMGYETSVLENPSREQIVRAFNKLALEAEGNDSVIIYYAGHGVLVPVEGVETGYWLPSDVNSEAPSSWLSNADIARMVGAVGARQVMLVSDSCYSGQLVGKDRVLVSSPEDASAMLKRRAAVVMSSGGDEPVADQGREGHSVFAWHFMRALEGLTQWQVGGSLYERVRAGVVKDFPQTPQYGANRGAGHQGNTDYLFERRELEAVK